MALALCMIVKNEEKMLPKAIESVKSIVDEIVVVDTGSTDNTKDIAKSYGAKVIPLEWNDNFGEARNVSIRNAKSDWILVIDADETIAKEDLSTIKELMKDKRYMAYAFIQRNYTNIENVSGFIHSDNDTYAESKNYPGWVESTLTRLFKNLPEIFYEDYVHEDVASAIMKKKGTGKICLADMPIHHFGRVIRSYEERLKWSDMYIRIGLKKLNDKIKANGSKRELAIACFEIGNSYGFKREMDKATDYYKKAEEYDSSFRPCISNLGMIYLDVGDYGKAEIYLKKATSIRDWDTPMVVRDYIALAKLYVFTKRITDAKHTLKACLKIDPRNAEVIKMMDILEFLRFSL
ncbi:MAG: hypothetical protein CVT89_04005 [Candidatus Altiarchaeales archaeon HGW-Altiarchaeales-2]|nr:MAG: hypothetical protein CVT89_04005 [Candidatus Altiarchaeales archaeon HGW-Altiarchaeales-2]